MKEAKTITEFKDIRETAAECGITLLVDDTYFYFNDVPKASGRVIFDSLKEVRLFVYGYLLGYKSGL